jgi:hypothetical protein
MAEQPNPYPLIWRWRHPAGRQGQSCRGIGHPDVRGNRLFQFTDGKLVVAPWRAVKRG